MQTYTVYIYLIVSFYGERVIHYGYLSFLISHGSFVSCIL